MKRFFYKNRYGLTLMLVLALVLQIVGPIVLEYVYAGEEGKEEAEAFEEMEALVEDEDDVSYDEINAEENRVQLNDEKSDEAEEVKEKEKPQEKPQPKVKAAPTPLSGGNLGNIFTFGNMWIGREYNEDGSIKEDGNKINEDTPVELDANTTVTIRYDWSVKEKSAKAGDYSFIQIPDIFQISGDFKDRPILLSDNNIQVGTWAIMDSILKFTFNSEIENLDSSKLKGTFVEFGFKLNMNKFEEDVKQKISFNDSINKEFNLVAKPELSEAKSISKVGVPKGTGEDGKKDAKTIEWTIDVLNTGETKLENVKLTDKLPEGLSLQDGSFKRTELTMNINGEKKTKGIATSITDITTTDRFSIELGDIEPYSGYRISYTTNITDFTKAEFTNTANIGEDNNLKAEGTVSGLTRSSPLEKKVTRTSEHEIDWEIYVNKGGIEINQPVVEDTLPDGLSIKGGVGDGVEVYRNNILVIDDVTKTISEQKLTVKLPAITKNDIYTIKYTTEIDYTKVNNGNYQKENEFKNSASIKDDDKSIGEEETVTATTTTTRKHLLYKEGSNPIKYGDTISWTINVNQAYHSIKEAKLHDIIPANLEAPSSLTIKKRAKGGAWIDVTDKSFIRPDGDGVRTIDFGNITEEFEITYKTKIKPQGLTEDAKFENIVWLTGINTGTGVGSFAQPIKTPVTPTNNSYTKKAGAIDYDNRTISWTIEIDPIKEAITELTIEDSFPNKGMIFLPDSLKVMIGEGDITNDNSLYTLSPNKVDDEEGYHKGFIIKFIDGDADNPILKDKKMTITYKTSFDPLREVEGNVLEEYVGPENKEYKNTVKITGKTKSDKNIDKTLTDKALNKADKDSPVWNSGKKEGRRVYLKDGVVESGWESGEERLIEWKIYINYLKDDLGKGVTVTDTINYEGKIDLDSVEIKKYSVDGLTGDTIDGDIVDITDIKSLTNEDKTLNIDFNEEVDDRYVIIYRTTVPEKSEANYTNNAMVKVEDKEYPYAASIRYSKHDSYITKSSNIEGTKAYTDDEIDWTININESLSTNMEDVEIVDTIAKGMAFKNDSMEIYRVDGSTETLIEEGESKDYTLEVVGDQNQETGTTVTIKFNKPINHKYKIKYKTIVTATSGNISNSAEVKGSHIMIEKISGQKYTAEKFGFTGGVLSNKGSIKIIKTDSNESGEKLSGAKFEVYYFLNGVKQVVTDAGGNGTHTTDSKGEIYLTNLVMGREYFVEEVEAPSGYIMDVDSEKSVILILEDGKKDIKLNFTNTKLADAKGSFELTKIDILTSSSLSNTKITVYKEDNTPVETKTTDENGKARFINLNVGKYYFVETEAPVGYVLNNAKHPFEIKKNGETIEDILTNTKIKGNVKLKKVDISDNPLKGAEFALYDTNDNQIGEIITSDENGEVLFENIPYGEYTIKEIKAPSGYYRSNEVIEVEIKEDGNTVEKDIDEKDLTVENRRIPPAPGTGGIEILKLDENGESLAGAVFELVQDGKVKYTSEPTGSDGRTVFNHIALGNYTLREKTAPTGYKLSLENREVSINVGGVIEKLEFTNTKIKGSIKLIKVDEKGKLLKGAEFSLYNLDGELVGKASSDKNGVVIFTNIPYGEYTVTETEAPEGYKLNDKIYKVSIKEDGTVVDMDIDGESLMVENIKTPTDPIDPTNPEDSDSTDPIDPTDPNEQGKPGEPGKPGQPGGSGEIGDPTDPSESGQPGNPTDPINPKEPVDSTDPKGNILAKTGSNIDFFIPIGFVMILVGVAYIYRDRLIKR